MSYQYPLKLRFKLVALSPQFFVQDVTGSQLMYVHQKVFKLKEDIRIYSDESRSEEIFNIRADRIIDFSANYHFTDSRTGQTLGSIKHKGLRSIWSATYLVFDASEQQTHTIREDNPWVKVMDALLDSVPVVNLFTGYVFHPSYTIRRTTDDQAVMQLKKEPSLFEKSFSIEKLDPHLRPDEETRLLLSILMMVQLERSRG